ncbi:hypothetical protein OIO90_006562 [Microbotryomycetes sp. JL221]|nr:hypothetical protein OIO90_006562 [Microbotryomycetes sp. JL221]
MARRYAHVTLISPLLVARVDLEECGTSVYEAFKQVSNASRASEHAAALAFELIELADDRISSFDYKLVPTCWRRLYTDASLLYTLVTMQRELTTAQQAPFQQQQDLQAHIVKQLDLAIIVAGAPGQDRLEMVLDVISIAQEMSIGSELASSPPSRPLKRQKRLVSNLSPSRLPAPHVTQLITETDSLPGFNDYMVTLCSEPFIVRQGSRHWPAFDKWRDPDYLSRAAGPHRVVPVEVGGDYTSSDWGQTIMPFKDMLRAMYNPSNEDQPKLYLAQHDLFKQLPQLERDIVVPDIVYSCPAAPQEFSSYEPVSNERGYILSAWLGPGGTLSPAHTDPYFNCYVWPTLSAQVVGSKWVWVAPPSCSAHMRAFAGKKACDHEPSPPPAELCSDSETRESEPSAALYLMTNTSSLDVTLAPDDSRLSRHVDFKNHVASIARQAVLEEGDILVMPPG